MGPRPLLAALLLVPAAPGAQTLGSADLAGMKEAAAKAPGVAGQAPAPLFKIVHGMTPMPERPTSENLTILDSDPDLPPVKDNAGLTRATPFYDEKQKMAIDWEDGGYAGSGESRSIAFFPAEIRIKYRLRQLISVSDRYAAGSCPYRETFLHEKDHWRQNAGLYEDSKEELAQLLEALRADAPIGAPGAPVSIAELEAKAERLQSALKKRVSSHGYAANTEALKNLAQGIRANGLNILASRSAPVHLKASSSVVARYQDLASRLISDEPPPDERCREGVLCYFKNVMTWRMTEAVRVLDRPPGPAGSPPTPYELVYAKCPPTEWGTGGPRP